MESLLKNGDPLKITFEVAIFIYYIFLLTVLVIIYADDTTVYKSTSKNQDDWDLAVDLGSDRALTAFTGIS